MSSRSTQALPSECYKAFPEYDGKIPYERRKPNTTIEDIYIIGYSIVSKMAHKNLEKIFRNMEVVEAKLMSHKKV